VHRSSAHQQIDFETLYRMYWPRIVRFCATCLAACPDGTAEEVAQDVFLAAHRALVEQRYRGDGSLSTWLFGIARNLCCKVSRDSYRQTTPLALRRLERDLARLEHHAADRIAGQVSPIREQGSYLQEQLMLARNGLEGAREHLRSACGRLSTVILQSPPRLKTWAKRPSPLCVPACSNWRGGIARHTLSCTCMCARGSVYVSWQHYKV
jgi:DNA-directed RNA polymerase specialized sigma24 family protein